MHRYTLGLISTILGTLGSVALGAGFYIPVQDPFALARGNAFVGDADSAAAVYYNPAGLTQLERPELQIGAYNINIHHEVNVDGQDYEAKREWQTIPQIYYAHPINERLTAGFGLNTPYGLGTRWGMETPFRTLSTNAELTYATLWSVVGVELDPKLSIGAGIGIHYAEALLEQGVGFFPNDEFSFKGDDVSPSIILSLHWKPLKKHSFGLTFRSKTAFDLSGTAETTGTNGFFPIGEREAANFDFETPSTVAFGYRYQFNKRWEFAADVEWVRFSSLKSSTVRTDSLDLPFVFNWKDSLIYSVGASHQFDNGYRFAFGYTFVGNSGPDNTFNPAIDDADRHWLTLGAGRDMDDWSWFVAYQYAFSDRRVSGQPLNIAGESADGDYDVNAHSVSISCTRRF